MEESHSRKAEKYWFSSFVPDKSGGKKGKKKKDYKMQSVFKCWKNYILSWISSIFLKRWVSTHSDVENSLGQKQFCRLYLCDFGVICVLHPETPSTIIPVYSYFSWRWRNFKSFCIADVQNNYVLPWTLLLQKISDSHFFPPLTKIWKYKLWGFLPAAFQMFWLGTCKVIKAWQFAFLSILHWHLGYS